MTAPPIKDTAGRPASELSGATATNTAPTPYVKVAGDTMTGDLTVPHVIGDGSGMTNLDFGKIQTSTLPATLAGHGITNGVTTAMVGVASGVAGLDSGGKVPTSELPAFSVSNTFVVASQAAMLALSAAQGDLAVRSDLSETFILTALPASTLANWVQLLSPTSPVSSVFGRTGAVVGAANDYAWNQLSGLPTTIDGLGVTADFQTQGDALWLPRYTDVLVDNTTRADSASAPGTPDLGGPYAAFPSTKSTLGISSNRLYDFASNSAANIWSGVAIDSGNLSQDVQGYFTVTSTFSGIEGWGIYFRIIDDTHYLYAAFDGSGGAQIYEVNGFASEILSTTGPAPAVNVPTLHQVIVANTSIVVKVNGVVRITYTLSSAEAAIYNVAGATRVGYFLQRHRYAASPSNLRWSQLRVGTSEVFKLGDTRYQLLGALDVQPRTYAPVADYGALQPGQFMYDGNYLYFVGVSGGLFKIPLLNY